MTSGYLRNIFETPYNRDNWFKILREVFGVKNLLIKPQTIGITPNAWNAKGVELGNFVTIEGHLVGIYEIEISDKINLAYNKVGLRNLLTPIYNNSVDAALIVFSQKNEWRFSYVSEIRVHNKETGRREKKVTDPKRFTYLLGKGQRCRTASERFSKISEQLNLYNGNIKLEEIERAFSVENLTKDFYRDLSNWYFRALEEVDFPDDSEKDKGIRNATNTIRLITRLIFVWFLKQKGLIPDALFNKNDVDQIINYNDKTGSTYYKAILQNLFFATLNTEMGPGNRKFVKGQYGIQEYYRYFRFFKKPDEFIEITKDIPFLNGGLFENLDKIIGQSNKVRIDCFSDNEMNEGRLIVPDSLFFDTEIVEANFEHDGKKGRNQSVLGLINILHNYNFTIEENTPFEIEVALDPELLGKIFENLLASYVPETETTARKMTGSFYTPREIVDFMVEESLKSYLSKSLIDDNTDKLQQLFSYTTIPHQFDQDETRILIKALNNAKILDPACGSGAFPMGMLHKMVFLLNKLDPGNLHWRELQRERAIKETEEAFNLGNREDREQRLLDISKNFEENSDDYGRKLYLIENCIYGIDIQPIAVQIAKLRFFISLICDQKVYKERKNVGVRPLPNLETKFIAANTLVSLNKPKQLPIGYDQVKELEKELNYVRHMHFSERNPYKKAQWRSKDLELRNQIAKKLEELGFPNDTAQKVSKWDPYDQNGSASFFDIEHMFNLSNRFDIVIGNPPYIRIQSLDKSLKNYFSKAYKSATKNYDLYVLFTECGMNLLNEGGNLIYIQPNKFFNSDYGIGLRELISNKKWLYKIVDFGAAQMFSLVTTYTCIFHCRKSNNDTFNYVAFKVPNITNSFIDYQLTSTISSDLVNEYFSQNFISSKSWSFGGASSINIFTKIESKGEPLKNYVKKIFQGLVTSADPVYILEETRDGFFSKYLEKTVKLERYFLKPLLKGSEIRRYKINFQSLRIIFPYEWQNGKTQLIKPHAFKIKYPLTWDYLVSCEEKLRNRENGKMDHDEWYAYVYPKNLEDFDNVKIMTQVLSRQASMVLDETDHYYFVGGGNAGGYGITLKANSPLSYKYLLGLLNSKLLDFYLQKHSSRFQNDYYSYAKRFIENIPILVAKSDVSFSIERLVEYILFCRQQENISELQNIASYFEQVINAIVYELYLPIEIENGYCSIIPYLPELLEIESLESQQEIIAYINELFQKIYDKNHQIRTVLFKLDSIEEVAIIEGKKK